MDSNSRILVAGARGLVGSAIVRNLKSKGYNNIIEGTRDDVDFTNQENTYKYFCLMEPEYVFLAAAKVGITEDQLMTGPLEPTNDAYAVAKIAGIKMCQSYRQQYGFDAIALQPTNLYGVNDNFNPESSHVIPGIMKRMHEAKLNNDAEFVCWGDGTPLREFLYIDDMAEACYTCMNQYSDSEIINIGTGVDISIKELTEMIANVVEYKGRIVWDTSKPNGTPRKVMNVDKLKSLGWEPKVDLKTGLQQTYSWFKENYDWI